MAIMTVQDGVVTLRRRTTVLRLMLIGSWLLVFPQLAGEIAFLTGTLDLADPESATTQAYGLMAIGVFVFTIATTILFGMWIYRAAANVIAAHVPGFDYTAGWAVGWYFIPFANLVKPFQAMRQIWNASLGGGGDLDAGHGILTGWWALWLLSNILANISARMAFSADTMDLLMLSSQIGIAAMLLDLLLLPIALRMVERIADGQSRNLDIADTFA